MDSQTRKKNIRTRLKRGDLKKLSEDLNMSYSYLSQAFSPGSNFTFTEELARKVEVEMGWEPGYLDHGMDKEPKDKHDSLFQLAIKYRAGEFAKLYPKKKVDVAQRVEALSIKRKADIVIKNANDSVYAVGLQSDQTDNEELTAQIIMLMAMTGAEYGFIYGPSSGVDPYNQNDNGYFREKRDSRWFAFQSNKVIEIESGPDDVFTAVGI